jgi:hypothetical protein
VSKHEQIKSSGLALIYYENEESLPPAEAYAEATKKLEELQFQAHKTTSIPLKTAYVTTSSQIHIDVRKREEEGVLVNVGPGVEQVGEEGEKVEQGKEREGKPVVVAGEAMRCDVEVEQVHQNLWRVNVTPREHGMYE